MADVSGALPSLKEALATLRSSSAAGYPESIIAQTINKLEVGIGKLEGEDVPVKPVVPMSEINAIPATNNRGDKGKAPPPTPKPAKKKFIAKYADGYTAQNDDRAKFADMSPGGAKRLAIEKQ